MPATEHVTQEVRLRGNDFAARLSARVSPGVATPDRLEPPRPEHPAVTRGERPRRPAPDAPQPGWFAEHGDPRTHSYWDGDRWVAEPWVAPDIVFISYARSDDTVVKRLLADLRAAGLTVWLDEALATGEVWWEEILRQIRGAAVFVHALSDASLASEPCSAERAYAEALGLPILPVQVGPTNLRTSPYGQRQLIDYGDAAHYPALRLVATLIREQADRLPLPDPLPAAPPVPFGYLLRLSQELDAPSLSVSEQRRLWEELLGYLDDATDTSVQSDIADLLRKLRDRPDAGFRVVRLIDQLLPTVET